MIDLTPIDVFQTAVYKVNRTEFLPKLQQVAGQYIMAHKSRQCDNDIYPVCQTDNVFNEPEIQDFCNFIIESSFAILDSQGYDASGFALSFNDMWVQEHRTGSGHDRHSHPGSVISGFYFIQAPPNSSRLIFYDPRPAKEFGHFFREKDPMALTSASNAMNIEPQDGMFVFSNSWLQHSFTRNESSDPFVMVHFDLYPIAIPQKKAIVI